MNRRMLFFAAAMPIGMLLPVSHAAEADWPTYRHDNQRSGVSPVRLQMPLEAGWTYRSPLPPVPSWPAPAQRDFWHRYDRLSPRAAFDRVFHTVISGNCLFFGSSADDRIYCLDTENGDIRWTYFTEGPIHAAPSISGEDVYVGSDDGRVYCLNVLDGALAWKYKPARDGRRILGNGRMISSHPIRTGVLVEDGAAYFCAGLFPSEGVYFCAIDAYDAAEKWKRRLADIAPQGFILASPTQLYIPNGRSAPWIFSRSDGNAIGQLSGAGGTYALLVDDILVHGPGSAGQLDAGRTGTRKEIASFNGLQLVVHEGSAYLQSADKLTALDRVRYFQLSEEIRALQARQTEIGKSIQQLGRETAGDRGDALRRELADVKDSIAKATRNLQTCFLWTTKSDCSLSLILAGDHLFAGGDGSIAAFDIATGRNVWTAPVEGSAYGLAVAGDALYVSTDRGVIYCFRRREGSMKHDEGGGL